MQPHDSLIAEHKKLRAQAETLEVLMRDAPQTLGEGLVRFQTMLREHFQREDVYYRVLDGDQRIADRGLIHQLRNDHAAVVFILESLAIRLRKNGCDADWRGRWRNLMNVFLPHLEKEEQTLFPLGCKLLSEQESRFIAEQMAPSD